MIQSPAPQAPPAAPQANNDTKRFSPHLDNAITSRKDQPSKADMSDKPAEKKRLAATSEEGLKSPAESTQTDNQSAVYSNSAESMTATDNLQDQTVAVNQTENLTDTVSSQHRFDISLLFDFLSNNMSGNIELSDAQGKSLQSSRINSPEGNLFKTPLVADLGPSRTTDADSLLLTAEASGAKPQTNPLLLQLQKIITNSEESGKVSITVTGDTLKAQSAGNSMQTITATIENYKIITNSNEPDNLSIFVSGNTQKGQSSFNNLQTIPAVSESDPQHLPMTYTDTAEFADDTTMLLVSLGSETPVDKGNQNMTLLRHSIQQQYYEGKVVPQINEEQPSSSESGRQGDNFLSKKPSAGEGITASAASPDVTNTFAQPLALVQEGQKLPTVEALQPVTLPSGTVVQQEEVIRQIAERMQISRRDNATRVNIQLHPAELGELKINLSVKEGLIRANVVASSQYAQDIIDKNMVKLRTVLESQGFTIGEITVTSKSDTAGDFNLFDRQLFSQNDYTPPPATNSRPPEAHFIMEDPDTIKQTVVSGVNVKI